MGREVSPSDLILPPLSPWAFKPLDLLPAIGSPSTALEVNSTRTSCRFPQVRPQRPKPGRLLQIKQGSQASLADRRAHVVYSDLPLGFAAWPGSIQWLLPWALCVIGLNKLASSWAILQDRYLQGRRGLPRKNSALSQPRLLGVD